MKSQIFVAGYVFVLTLGLPAAVAEAGEVTHRVELPQQFTPDMSPDVWVNGCLPRFERPVSGRPARVWMHDRFGNLVIAPTEITLPDAHYIHPFAITASPDGRSALLSAEVWGRAGAAKAILCRVVAPGRVDQVVRTGDFLAEEVGLAADGSIWTFGAPLLERFRKGGDYTTAAWYSPSGVFRKAFLPRSTFGTEYRPTKSVPAGRAAIATSLDRVALFSSVASQWIEYDTEGNLIARVHVDLPKASDQTAMKLIRLVMTSSNRVYGWFYASVSRSRHGALYQLDRSAGTWIAVPPDLLPLGFTGLFGSDGEQIILRSGPSLYGWYTPPDMLRADR
jgi:hypothetical protein